MRTLCLGSLFLGLGAGAVFAQADSTVTTETYRDWLYNCATVANETRCEVMSNLMTTEGAVFAQMSVQTSNETSAPLFQLAVPTFVDLKRGVSLSIEGGQSFDLAFSFCNAQACFVAEPLSDPLLEDLKKANRAALKLRSMTNGTIDATFSLLGFSAAFERLGAD